MRNSKYSIYSYSHTGVHCIGCALISATLVPIWKQLPVCHYPSQCLLLWLSDACTCEWMVTEQSIANVLAEHRKDGYSSMWHWTSCWSSQPSVRKLGVPLQPMTRRVYCYHSYTRLHPHLACSKEITRHQGTMPPTVSDSSTLPEHIHS